MFKPQLHILPPAQRLLWDELHAVPGEFVLYGGTAIALHLGHRHSIDFDFFSPEGFDPPGLYDTVPFLAGAEVTQQAKNTLTFLIHRGGPVKVSFFGVPQLGRVEEPHVAEGNRLKVASLVDLAGTKAAVVQQRAEAKDYLDLDALMLHGVGLPTALAAARAIHGGRFNPQVTLKALSYFEEGSHPALPAEVKRRIVNAVAAVDLDALPCLVNGAGQRAEQDGGERE
jgi:hypothetical protein